MGNHDDDHSRGVVVDLVHDAIVTDPDPPGVAAGQRAAPLGSRRLGQALQSAQHSFLVFGGDPLECLRADRRMATV